MIYSNDIEKLGLFSAAAADFVRTHDVAALENGRYELADGDFVNVQSYTSKDRATCVYENHHDYIDIQMVFAGEELLELAPVETLNVSTPYDGACDAELYANDVPGEAYVLCPGRFMVLEPGDGHMPGLALGAAAEVKKAIFKVRVR